MKKGMLYACPISLNESFFYYASITFLLHTRQKL